MIGVHCQIELSIKTRAVRICNIFLSGDNLDDTDDGQPEVVKLRHPASSKPAIFVFSPGNITVQEVLMFDESKRSWFIDDNVKSDGKLHLSTPIDPIFLVLPYLRKVIIQICATLLITLACKIPVSLIGLIILQTNVINIFKNTIEKDKYFYYSHS